MNPAVCIGLMSGTSLDAVDAAACVFDGGGRWLGLLGTASLAYPANVRTELLELQRAPQTPISLHKFAELDQAVAATFADATLQLIEQLPPAERDIQVLGSHGQTIFHDPIELRTSIQLGNPSLIAARTGIRTVADFRRADMALQGQGAPLVPAFHHAIFAADTPRVIANIGGIANITVLPDRDPARSFGFDTGPGNALMDDWIQRQQSQAFDRDGSWAANGQLDNALLADLLADPYFELPPPKSTGRDYFNLSWVAQRASLDAHKPQDLQRTLGELTVESLARAITRHAAAGSEVFVCGGGTRNGWLMQRLNERLASPVATTAALGLDPAWIETAAFAWLAWQTVNGRPGNLPNVTGAQRAAVLGGVFAP